MHPRRRFGSIQSVKLRPAPGRANTYQYALIAFGAVEDAHRASLALNGLLIPDLCDTKRLKCKFSPGIGVGGNRLDDSEPTAEECELSEEEQPSEEESGLGACLKQLQLSRCCLEKPSTASAAPCLTVQTPVFCGSPDSPCRCLPTCSDSGLPDSVAGQPRSPHHRAGHFRTLLPLWGGGGLTCVALGGCLEPCRACRGCCCQAAAGVGRAVGGGAPHPVAAGHKKQT
jgi:hypothetical protein